MFKFIALFAFLAVASAAPGFITEHHSIVQAPVLAKTALVDHSGSSAITHQSFTNLERKVAVAPVVHTYAATPVLKSVAAPIVHSYAAEPIVKTVAAPVVHTYAAAAAPVVHHTYAAAAAPVVHHTYAAAAPVIHHSAPLVKTILSSPVAYTTYH